MKKICNIIFTFILLSTFLISNKVLAVYSDAQVGNYATELAKFPSGYKSKIEALHNIYPNAIFVAQDKFFDWGTYTEIPVDWNIMVSVENSGQKSLIEASAQSNYKTSACAQTNSDGSCTWYVASKDAVTYYLNPYNFLDEKHVFMFESQYYKDYHVEQGVEKILSTTAYANKNCPGSDKTYAQVILEAGVKYNVSPYMLAARLRQENGKGTSDLVTGNYPGYEGYYDYYNVKASGANHTEIVTNGLKKAKEEGWTTPYLSIIGGAKFIYKSYVGINDTYNVKGQMTNYLQKWDPYGIASSPYKSGSYGGHQYMQNVRAPYSEAETTYSSYASFTGYKNFNYIFYIPIFKNAPNLENNNTNNNNNNNSEVKPTIVKGDANGDGKVSALDYVTIKNHIMRTNVISDSNKLLAADANGDGKVSALDYVTVKNKIMGG